MYRFKFVVAVFLVLSIWSVAVLAYPGEEHVSATLPLTPDAGSPLSAATLGLFPQALADEIPPPPADTRPDQLVIPKIKVDAQIIPVGLTETNNLDVPNNYTEVGWYQYGPTPAATGTAVIDGHVDNGALIKGPFKRLKELHIGDEMFVTDKEGVTNRFVVTHTAVYDYTKFPSEKIFHQGDESLLKIITCHGTYLPSVKTYNKRLVVTAKLANQPDVIAAHI